MSDLTEIPSDNNTPAPLHYGDKVDPINPLASTVMRGAIIATIGIVVMIFKAFGKTLALSATDMAALADLLIQAWPLFMALGGIIMIVLGRLGICMPIVGTKAAQTTVTLQKPETK